MILNEKQYQFTKQQLEGFKSALALIDSEEYEDKYPKKDSLFKQLNREGLESFIDDFTAQIQEYENLVNRDENSPLKFSLNNLEELPIILIKTRIALKISQQELASRLGMTLKQLQLLEEREYETVNLSQLWDISSALEIKLKCNTSIFLSPEKLVA